MHNKILIFFNQMRYRAGTGELNGLRDLTINTTNLRFKPAIDDATAYGLFDYMVKLCEQITPKISVAIAVNAAAYLVDHGIPFTIRFKWDGRLSFLCNMKYILYNRNFRKMLRKMKADMEANPSSPWTPYCEEALFQINDTMQKGETA